MIEPTPPRHETVILWHGDDYEPLADLRSKVEAAARSAMLAEPARLGDDSEMQAVAAEYDAFREEALKRATRVELRALGRKAWRALLLAHPARKVTEADENGTTREVTHPDDAIGWNTESIAEPLVIASLAPGQFESDEKRDAWLDGLSDPEFSRLYSAAVALNIDGGPDPKVQISSLLDRSLTETSKSPERLG